MSAEPTEHISFGLVKRVTSATTPEGTELHVQFWDRGQLVVRAQFAEPLTLDLTPAILALLLPEHVRLAGAIVRDATIYEQREATLRHVQQVIHDGGATHDCGEWRSGLRCAVCGAWLGAERES